MANNPNVITKIKVTVVQSSGMQLGISSQTKRQDVGQLIESSSAIASSSKSKCQKVSSQWEQLRTGNNPAFVNTSYRPSIFPNETNPNPRNKRERAEKGERKKDFNCTTNIQTVSIMIEKPKRKDICDSFSIGSF